jgi:hypothetical protein
MADQNRRITPERMLCSDLRHGWNSVGDLVLLEQQGKVRVFQRVLECFRCLTVRTDTYRITPREITRVGSHYRYPEGYLIKGGVPVAEVRFLMFRNADIHYPEQQ